MQHFVAYTKRHYIQNPTSIPRKKPFRNMREESGSISSAVSSFHIHIHPLICQKDRDADASITAYCAQNTAGQKKSLREAPQASVLIMSFSRPRYHRSGTGRYPPG